uniref:EIF-2B GDP-GTP exchange factor subunit alpha n=1 Tax=Rhabditophanes sp. KR3021 TaxID=114890 RepID=A0AC35TXD2_9BILA
MAKNKAKKVEKVEKVNGDDSGVSPPFCAVAFFKTKLEENKDKISTGSAVIKTLKHVLDNSDASTIAGLLDELKTEVNKLCGTDYSTASIRSASELFIRSISLVSSETMNQDDFKLLLNTFRHRAKLFSDRVELSRSLIGKYAAPYIVDDMKILTHSFSKVVFEALETAAKQGKEFKVFVTESMPDASGKYMLEKLRQIGIPCTLILDSAVGYLMESVDIILLGAEGVMETGGIINKIGSLGIAICAKAYNKPVCIMAESIKFVKEYPLNQSDIPNEFKYNTSTLKAKNLNTEHPLVDYTPPGYIYLLFTDLGILTPANVGEELIKLYT